MKLLKPLVLLMVSAVFLLAFLTGTVQIATYLRSIGFNLYLSYFFAIAVEMMIATFALLRIHNKQENKTDAFEWDTWTLVTAVALSVLLNGVGHWVDGWFVAFIHVLPPIMALAMFECGVTLFDASPIKRLVETLQADKRALEQEEVSSAAEIETLQARIESLQQSSATNKTLQQDYDQQKVQLQQLQSEKAKLQATVRKLQNGQTNLQALATEKETLQADLQSAQSTIQTLQADLQTATKKSQTLASKLQAESKKSEALQLPDQALQFIENVINGSMTAKAFAEQYGLSAASISHTKKVLGYTK